MTNEKEMTAPIVSVGADTEQSSQNLTGNSLTDFDPDFKGFDEMQREILRMMDKAAAAIFSGGKQRSEPNTAGG